MAGGSQVESCSHYLELLGHVKTLQEEVRYRELQPIPGASGPRGNMARGSQVESCSHSPEHLDHVGTGQEEVR